MGPFAFETRGVYTIGGWGTRDAWRPEMYLTPHEIESGVREGVYVRATLGEYIAHRAQGNHTTYIVGKTAYSIEDTLAIEVEPEIEDDIDLDVLQAQIELTGFCVFPRDVNAANATNAVRRARWDDVAVVEVHGRVLGVQDTVFSTIPYEAARAAMGK